MENRSITLIEDHAVDKLIQAQSLLECQQTATHHSPIGLNAIKGIESLVRGASDGLISWDSRHGFHQAMNRLGLDSFKALQFVLYEHGRGCGHDWDDMADQCMRKIKKANDKAIEAGANPWKVLECNLMSAMGVMEELEPGWFEQFNCNGHEDEVPF